MFEHQGTGDSTGEDPNLYKVRTYSATIRDFDNYFKSKIKDGKSNPYGDNSLPYQDFQDGKSDLVKNRYGKQ